LPADPIPPMTKISSAESKTKKDNEIPTKMSFSANFASSSILDPLPKATLQERNH
jgi:hypothetical protein